MTTKRLIVQGSKLYDICVLNVEKRFNDGQYFEFSKIDREQIFTDKRATFVLHYQQIKQFVSEKTPKFPKVSVFSLIENDSVVKMSLSILSERRSPYYADKFDCESYQSATER